MKKLGTITNTTAGLLTISCGVLHLFLPYVFPWQEQLEQTCSYMTWAMFADNFFFSILLIWAGLLSLVAFSALKLNKTGLLWVTGGMSLFWLIGCVYEIIFPFPFPVVEWVLPIFAFLTACLYGVALFSSLRGERTRHSQVQESIN